ncbi:MAG: tRNA (guanosine(46)-N7)-methyltransferase TrmB [Bacteroidota bacterium]
MRQKLRRFTDISERDNVIEQGKKMFNSIKGKWNLDYFKNNGPIYLELACGRGEYTVGMARFFPEKNYIGVDLKGDRIWKGSSQAVEENLKNVAFLRADIRDLNSFFTLDEVQEIWVLFPDPRPKLSDERRRIMNNRFLDIYKNILEPDGAVKLKTDNSGFFEYSLEVLERRNDIKNLVFTHDLYHSELKDEHFGLETRYERKFRALGNDIKYLKFQFTTCV